MNATTWMYLLAAMTIVESSGDNNAVNIGESAYGPLQVRAAALADVNARAGTGWTLEDCRNPTVARWVVVQYAARYQARTPEDVCRLWNGGPDRGPRHKTGKYWSLVRAEMVRAGWKGKP